jgi:predicted DCC family thiol-disulfide oxidoreductase YuxK
MTHQLYEACGKALHVVTNDGKLLQAGEACLFILRVLGWRNAARVLSLPPLLAATELGYRLVAANRRHISRLFGWDACALPQGK